MMSAAGTVAMFGLAYTLGAEGREARMRFTKEVSQDAGYLREYLARTYGPSYFFGQGLGYSAHETMLRLAKRLARMAGTTLDDVFLNMQRDTEVIMEEE